MASISTSRETHKAQDFSASDKAVHRMRAGNDAAKSLAAAAIATKDTEDVLAVADMIACASKPEYVWHGDQITDAVGKPFAAHGSLIIPSSRANQAYMKASAARARKTAKKAMNSHKPLVGEDRWFLTFTIPSDFGFDGERAFALLDGAIRLLKKRKWFRSQVAAGVFGTELTTGANKTHYHPHQHALCWSRKFGKPELLRLRQEYTECLKEVEPDLKITTTDNLAVVNVKPVKIREKANGREMTLEKAITETCKYTVKGTDFAKMPPALLCEVERLLRGRKMLSTFRANRRKGSAKKGLARQVQYLDKTCTNDGISTLDPVNLARVFPFLVVLSVVRSILLEADARARNRRVASRITLAVRVYVALAVERFKLEHQRRRYLAGDKYDSKFETLGEYGARMIRAGKRETWLETLQKVYAARAKWRKEQLSIRYRKATFRTLDGQIWYGRDVVTAGKSEAIKNPVFKAYLSSPEYKAFKALNAIQRGTLSDRTESLHPPLTTVFPATFPAALSLA
jgi:hypothetical protein